MRSPLPGLVCVLVAAACSTEKPAAIPAPTTVSRTGGAHDVSVTGESSVPNVKADHARS